MSFNERHKHRHHDAGVNLPVSPSDVINGLRIQHPQFNTDCWFQGICAQTADGIKQ